MRTQAALTAVLALCIGLGGGSALADDQDHARPADRPHDGAAAKKRDHRRADVRRHRARAHDRQHDRKASAVDLKHDLASLQELGIDYDELRKQAARAGEQLGVDLKGLSLDTLRASDAKSMSELHKLLSSYLSARQQKDARPHDAVTDRLRAVTASGDNDDHAPRSVIDEATTKRLRSALHKLRNHGRHRGVRIRRLKHDSKAITRAAHRAHRQHKVRRDANAPSDRSAADAPARTAAGGSADRASSRSRSERPAAKPDSRE